LDEIKEYSKEEESKTEIVPPPALKPSNSNVTNDESLTKEDLEESLSEVHAVIDQVIQKAN